MKYLRIYSRGRWRAIHYMSDAAIRTLCGIEVGKAQAMVEISADRPNGRVCWYCERRLKEDGSTAWR